MSKFLHPHQKLSSMQPPPPSLVCLARIAVVHVSYTKKKENCKKSLKWAWSSGSWKWICATWYEIMASLASRIKHTQRQEQSGGITEKVYENGERITLWVSWTVTSRLRSNVKRFSVNPSRYSLLLRTHPSSLYSLLFVFICVMFYIKYMTSYVSFSRHWSRSKFNFAA